MSASLSIFSPYPKTHPSDQSYHFKSLPSSLHFTNNLWISLSLSNQMTTLLGFSHTKLPHCNVSITSPTCSSSSTVVSMVGRRSDSKTLRSGFLGRITHHDRLPSTGRRSSSAVKMSWDGSLASVKLIIQGKNLEVWNEKCKLYVDFVI